MIYQQQTNNMQRLSITRNLQKFWVIFSLDNLLNRV